MARTVLTIPDEQLRQAKARAAELGVSLSEYVRRAIELELGDEAPAARAGGLFDLGGSGGSAVAHRKDEYVAGAVARER